MHGLTRPLNRLRIPLSWVVILPLVLGIVAAVVLTGWLSLHHSQQMMTNTIAHLGQELRDRLEQRLESYLDLPHRANQVTLSVLDRDNLWNPDDMTAMQQHLIGQMRSVFPELMFLGCGGEQGEFAGVYRTSEGLLEVRRTDRTTHWVNVATTVDFRGRESQFLYANPDYDPRKRIWYQEAVAANRAVWSELYFNKGNKSELVLSAATPFRDATGQLRGVVLADVSLKTLSDFLNRFKINAHSYTVLLDREGKLIAQSDIVAVDKRNPVDRGSLMGEEIRQLEAAYGSLVQIQKPQQLFLEFEDRQYLLGVTPIQDDRGLDWLMILAIPPEDLEAYLPDSTPLVLGLCGLALFLGISVALLASRWIVRPIWRLSRASQAIAKGFWQQELPPSPIQELDAVACSFAQMMQQLQQSQDDLETKIQQRTEQLQQEIRDRQATEARLRENQRALSTLMSNLPGMAYRNRYDGEWTMEVVSEGCKQLTGYCPEDLLYNRAISFEHLTHPEDRAWVRGHIYGAVAQNKPFQLVYRIVTASGQAKWIWEKGRGIFDESGNPIALEGFMTDIDERKRTEDALRESQVKLKQAKEAAEAANRTKSVFFAKMSHELRTPLNGILGYTQILRRSPALTTDDRKGLDVIYQCGSYLLTLINDILTLSKIEACKLDLNLESHDLPNLLRYIFDLCSLKVRDKAIELVYEVDEDLPAIVILDRKRLQQVLLNLLDNGIKFTHTGQVTLRVQRLTTDAQSLQQRIRFQVEDTGKGLTPEQLTKIFLPFEQVGDLQDREQGVGLGLEIAQQLVELMGGTLTARSIPGQGSVFSFDLNLARSQTLPVEGRDRAELTPGLQGSKRKITLIDGDREYQSLLKSWLQPLGFKLQTFSNFTEHLDCAIAFQPDLILGDAALLQGEMLETYQQHCPTTVILKYGASEGDDFLPKPLLLPELLQHLQQHLQLSWIRPELGGAIAKPSAIELPSFRQIPPTPTLQQWLKLAKRGRILELEKAVQTFAENNSGFTAFTETLIQACQNFQLATIKQLLNHVLASDFDSR